MGFSRNHRRAGSTSVLAGLAIGVICGLTACGAGDGEPSARPSAGVSIDRPSREPDAGNSPPVEAAPTEAQPTRSREVERTTEPAETTTPPPTPAETTTRPPTPAKTTTRPPTSAAVVPTQTTKTQAPTKTTPPPTTSSRPRRRSPGGRGGRVRRYRAVRLARPDRSARGIDHRWSAALPVAAQDCLGCRGQGVGGRDPYRHRHAAGAGPDRDDRGAARPDLATGESQPGRSGEPVERSHRTGLRRTAKELVDADQRLAPGPDRGRGRRERGAGRRTGLDTAATSRQPGRAGAVRGARRSTAAGAATRRRGARAAGLPDLIGDRTQWVGRRCRRCLLRRCTARMGAEGRGDHPMVLGL